MRNEKIVGRYDECKKLDECLNSNSAELVIVYGRRRVGKTYLINQYFNNKFAFKLTGAYGQPMSIQLRNFTAELSRKSEKKYSVPKDWIEAFELLRIYIDSLPTTEKQVVFLDELPWFDTKRSGFILAFEWFWNDYASTKDNLIFIVCGSATSWMMDNLANNKGGLFNRETLKLYLKPFTLFEVEEYLNKKGFMWSRFDIAECYMILGGIPFYLSLIRKNLSLSQNIDALFFKEKGELWDEFQHLYATLFTNSEKYIKVVEALSKKKSGLTKKELSEIIKLPYNGAFSKILNNLVNSGFVRVSKFYGCKKKDELYQLSDYFTSFYFHFVKSNYGKDEHFWSNSIDNPKRTIWRGLSFEQLCKDHIKQIKSKLGIQGILSEESIWYSKDEPGAQIDLLIDRRDRVINICEMKYSINEFTIDKSYDKVLRNKIESFISTTACTKSIQLTMVTTYGIKNNMYSNIIGNEIMLSDLFTN